MTTQRGQAIVEMLVASMAIIMLLWALLWLQRWQQVKLQTQHHAALQAFRFSQSYALDEKPQNTLKPTYLEGLFSAIAHQEQSTAQALGAMPAQHSVLDKAQQEGLLGQSQRWRFSSRAQAKDQRMQLQSQTSIWVGAGQANHDAHMVQRLEKSPSLWGQRANSAAAIKALQPRLKPVDAAWGRSSPSTNWLQPWQESVPAQHLEVTP